MADLVILNGKLITFDGPDAEAMVIENGRIKAVGTTAEIREISGGARVIDACGNTVLPGFIDSHVHLFQGAVESSCLNLHGVSSKDELAALVRKRASDELNAKIIFCFGIDYHAMDGAEPDRHHMDDILRDRPFAAMAADHHTVWANTKALEAADLLHGKDLPHGSEVVMAADGKATGLLIEVDAFAPLLAMTENGGRHLAGYETGSNPVPAPTHADRAKDKDTIAKALEYCAAQGITSLHNMDGNFYQLELLSELEAEGRLLCRTEVPMHFKSHDPITRLEEADEMRQAYNGDMVWCNRIKFFMDGVMESKTAFMSRPFKGCGTIAEPLYSQSDFDELCIRSDAMGFQIAVHSIGDAAVNRVLNGYEAARRTNGPRDSRHRIEHIESLNPKDLPRFAELGVVASMQPLHSPAGGFFDIPDNGQGLLWDEQIEWSFPIRRLKEAGAHLILSTDWPVVPIDVMPTIQGAVVGKTMSAPWQDDHLPLRDALSAYTKDAAWVEFNEAQKGRLKPGMMADVVIMDQDLERLPGEDLHRAQAVTTISAGKVVFER